MKRKIEMKFDITIFDLSILDLIPKKVENYKEGQYYDNDFCLIIYVNPNKITDDCLNGLDFPYWRVWHNNYDFLENIELAIRVITSKIKERIEDCNFNIGQVFVKSDNSVECTEIQLVRIGLHNYENKKKNPVKIHLDIHILDGRYIFKIVDSIEYIEQDYYIDERNNNKNYYNSLLLKKEKGENIEVDTLSEQDWKQLCLKEKVTNRELADLYEILESTIAKSRKKFIPSIKQYDDEYLFYYAMFNSMTISDYYSNFCIPLLEQMKSKNIKVIYEYLNLDYRELFYVEEELKRQKEIERNNLAGEKYVMPLSGILLKKLYWAIKNHQLDRKFLKNNWFNTYYGTMFLKDFLETIEKSHILDLYENGKIYEHPYFESYQKLYKKLNLKESEKIYEQKLTKVEASESKEHIKSKMLRKISPRNHIDLAIIKNEVGRFGEELVYNYEMEALKEYPRLQKKIKKTYLLDEGAGYDIESYDYDGNKIFIEVKTNKSNYKNRIKFYISKNEDEFICNHRNAYIYYIYDLENPKIRVIDQKTYLSYYKKAIGYEIDQEIVPL